MGEEELASGRQLNEVLLDRPFGVAAMPAPGCGFGTADALREGDRFPAVGSVFELDGGAAMNLIGGFEDGVCEIGLLDRELRQAEPIGTDAEALRGPIVIGVPRLVPAEVEAGCLRFLSILEAADLCTDELVTGRPSEFAPAVVTRWDQREIPVGRERDFQVFRLWEVAGCETVMFRAWAEEKMFATFPSSRWRRSVPVGVR